MLLTIGGRYLVFDTAYDMKHYWALGLSLAVGAVIEAGFSGLCLLHYFWRVRPEQPLQRRG